MTITLFRMLLPRSIRFQWPCRRGGVSRDREKPASLKGIQLILNTSPTVKLVVSNSVVCVETAWIHYLLKVLDPTSCSGLCSMLFLEQAPVSFCAQVESARQTSGMQSKHVSSNLLTHNKDVRTEVWEVSGKKHFNQVLKGEWDLTGDGGKAPEAQGASRRAETGWRWNAGW